MFSWVRIIEFKHFYNLATVPCKVVADIVGISLVRSVPSKIHQVNAANLTHQVGENPIHMLITTDLRGPRIRLLPFAFIYAHVKYAKLVHENQNSCISAMATPNP
jgi:hypothetical protein